MDSVTIDAPIAPIAAPVPPPQAVAPVAPAAAPSLPMQPSSYESGGSIVDTLKNINWFEIGFGILSATAFYFAINYYRYTLLQNKTKRTEIQNQVDELAIKIADVQSLVESNKKTTTNTPQIF